MTAETVPGIGGLLASPIELDFAASERILVTLSRQARTVADYPRIRPRDCESFTLALEAALEATRPQLMLGDLPTARRFDAIVDAYVQTDVKFYPRQLFRARLLHAEIRILMNDFVGAREALAAYLDSPFALEGDLKDLILLFHIDCRIRAATTDVEEVGRLATIYVLALIRLRPLAVRKIVAALWPFVGLGPPPAKADVWGRWLHAVCGSALKARRGSGLRALPQNYLHGLAAAALAQAFLLGAHYGRERPRETLATRAMGGIGDLLMMTPGLRALAKRQGRPVKFAIPRKLCAVFENNPHIELLDIDKTPVELVSEYNWRNLTICPAGAYEARHRPFVKKSRIELFARGLGVERSELDREGWGVELHLDDRQKAFAESFLRSKEVGTRPLVGVQPYSRDSYKDSPGVCGLIESLARDYDVLVFHHTDAGLPSGPGIITTAGLTLSQSLALVSRLTVMVSGDSAFLHAAAAFDIPALAMFGPTDGALFTRHHRRATVFQNKAAFPCSPCWRNEDIPCQVTGRVGGSPCIASLDLDVVRQAVVAAVGPGRPRLPDQTLARLSQESA